MSAALFSHLKVSKTLSVSFSVVLYRIHTLCCIFSPSKSAHFVPAILEQSRGPPTSATATSSIVFLDKGERWQTTQGIRKDLPLNDRPGLSDGKKSSCPCGHSRLDFTSILYGFLKGYWQETFLPFEKKNASCYAKLDSCQHEIHMYSMYKRWQQ